MSVQGIHVDREVEEIRHEHRRTPAARLQDVQPLDDDDVGLPDHLNSPGDVGCQMRDTGADFSRAGLTSARDRISRRWS
jgi:hypothetical protein